MIDKKFKTDAIIGYLTQGVSIASGFLLMLLITEYSGIGVYGALMLLSALCNVLGNLVGLRTNEALVAFYRMGAARQDWSQCKFAVAAGLLMDATVGVVLVLLLVTGDDLIASRLLKDSGSADAVAFYGFAVLFGTLRSTPMGYLQATERIKSINLITLLEQVLKLASVGAIVLFPVELSLRNIVLGFAGASAVATVACFTPMISEFQSKFSRVPLVLEKALVAKYCRYSVSTFVSSALKAGNQNIDTLILGYLTDSKVAGVYATFRQFLSPLNFVSVPFSTIAFPKFVTAVAENRRRDIKGVIETVNQKLLIVCSVGVVALFLAVTVYAEAVDLNVGYSGYAIWLVMAITAVIRTRLWWARAFSNAVDPNLAVLSNLIATVISIMLLPVLTYQLEIAGTAIGMFAIAVGLSFYWKAELAKRT